MYIAVLDGVPDHMVPVLVAHAVLGAHMAFEDKYLYTQWLKHSFKKVVVRVNQKEFDKITKLDTDVYLAHENTTLGGAKSCAVVLPQERPEVFNVLHFAKLWSPK